MADQTGVSFVLPIPKGIADSDENNYFAVDGWSIETIDGKLVFCASDPGHGGAPIRINLSRRDLDYAKKNHPNWYQICQYLHENGYW